VTSPALYTNQCEPHIVVCTLRTDSVRFNAVDFSPDQPDERELWPKGVVATLLVGGISVGVGRVKGVRLILCTQH